MINKMQTLIELLNNKDVNIRLTSLKNLIQLVYNGEIEKPLRGNDINNHVHTTFSFSPYSPTKAVWMAYTSGLSTVGIVDHDSISGAREFISAGKIVGIPTTIGVECRVDFSKTPLKDKFINNQDQKSIAYMLIHGIPHNKIDDITNFFTPFLIERNKRNKLMISRINKLIESSKINLNFENDVLPLSLFEDGGSITERHILFALSQKLIQVFNKGERLVEYLKNQLGMKMNIRVEEYLLNVNNSFYEYDLLGALKSDLAEKFYINAKDECPDVIEVVELANRIGAISAYAYQGDVEDSVTGDKRTQKFEDEYIELLFEVISNLKFNAVAYMPSRNSINQLRKVRGLCDKYGLLQICGEDINTPRQLFICDALRNKEFNNLVDSTWALIGHEKSTTQNLENSMFSNTIIAKYPSLNERIEVYKKIGMRELQIF